MKLTPEEKTIAYRIASFGGLALAVFIFLLMILVSEEQWRMNGPIYMLMGVLGYFSFVCIGLIAFLRMEVKGVDGTLRRVTVWEILGYGLLGGAMSQITPYLEAKSGLSSTALTVIAVVCLALIGTLLYLRNRQSKAAND